MSIYKGTTLIASGLPVAGFPLFYHTFQDHVLNNTSWLRADTFSWQSGAVYVSAYNHLVDDISGITAETETISGTTITFYRATDGHKIVLADQESNVSAIYTATGVAWYYILDTVNARFKLPRSKWNFVGLRDSVGNYVAESLPNITGSISGAGYLGGASSGALKISDLSGAYGGSGGGRFGLEEFDASLSSSVYQNDAPVQQRATQAYLYFYVGNTVQDQTIIDVGEITDTLNGKVDIDLANVSATGKQVARRCGIPDWSSAVVVKDWVSDSANTFTATVDCFISFSAFVWSNSAFRITINDVTCNKFTGTWSGQTSQCCNFYGALKAGDTIKFYYEESLSSNLTKYLAYIPLGA